MKNKLVMGCLTDSETVLYLCQKEEIEETKNTIKRYLKNQGLLDILVWELKEGNLPKDFKLDGKIG